MSDDAARPTEIRLTGVALLRAHVRALRPRQWAKNGLVLAGPLAAGALLNSEVVIAVAIAFVAFCLASSATYLANDVHDLAEDRAHPAKRKRPVAGGLVAPGTAIALSVVLAMAGLAVAALASPRLVLVIGVYLALSLSYTLALKQQAVIELAIVAAGFVLRALAGVVAAGISASQWFLLVAAFGSLFMVTGKRFSEALLRDTVGVIARRSLEGYTLGYLRFVWTLAATVTVTTYALWAFEMQTLLPRPILVQASIVPFVLGILRYAVDIEQGKAEEPETIALNDRVLQLLGLSWLALFTLGNLGR